jgi:hypothetical protein
MNVANLPALHTGHLSSQQISLVLVVLIRSKDQIAAGSVMLMKNSNEKSGIDSVNFRFNRISTNTAPPPATIDHVVELYLLQM